jgi:hypothetical protein
MTPPTRMSCSPMMALTLGTLKTCMRALETHEPSYTDNLARFGAVGHTMAPEPSIAGRWGLEPRYKWWHKSPP